jgi:FKBP-type peptidyl-prolyl cis-trans isomerase SlpA
MNDAPKIAADSFVTLHYALKLVDGTEAVSTFDLSPATLQMGGGQMADTLERCLLGLAAGERKSFALPPAAGFGEHNPRLVEWIARSALPPGVELRENALIEFTAPDGGGFAGFCRELNDTHALFDFNHPLAGKPITFDVHVIGVM